MTSSISYNNSSPSFEISPLLLFWKSSHEQICAGLEFEGGSNQSLSQHNLVLQRNSSLGTYVFYLSLQVEGWEFNPNRILLTQNPYFKDCGQILTLNISRWTKVVYLSFDKFLLVVESRDLSQADKIIMYKSVFIPKGFFSHCVRTIIVTKYQIAKC